jgi:membrane dipeptidase
MRLRRREFIVGGVAAAVGAATTSSAIARAMHTGYGADRYEHAMVIDAQGTIGDPDWSLQLEGPPSERLKRDLRDSGLAAVSMTLSVGSTGDRMEIATRKIAIFDEKVASAPELLMRIRTAADLKATRATHRLGLIFNLQDSSLLENDLSRVTLCQRMGIRVMQLTYNTRNLVGDGCLEVANSGLSNLGHKLVAELNRQRIVMDLSHAGQRTIAEAIAEAQAPPIISHTGCRDLLDRPRNVFDAELKTLADKGGVAGIYFMPFLAADGHVSREDLIRHIEHAVDVCGEDHVGLGTDGTVSAVNINDEYRKYLHDEFESRTSQGTAAPGEAPDALQLVVEYNEPRRFLHLAEDLSARGWPARRIDKLLGENFARVFGEVWG